jgi:Ca2+-binding RTX toxin-like protein
MPRSLMSSVVALVAVTGGLAVVASPAGAAYDVDVRNQTLRITGNGASDRLALRLSGDALQVDVGDNGSADFEVPRDSFERIRVRAGGGNDLVRIDDSGGIFTDDVPTRIDGQGGRDTLRGGRGAERLHSGAAADVLDGNGGDDVADLGAGNDRFVWDPGDGSDVVEGQAGADAMTFNGSNASEQFDVSANGQRVRFVRNVANIVMDLDDVEEIDANALGGADGLTVSDLSGTDLTGVRADLAGDGQPDTVTAVATNGGDAISVAGSAGNATVSGVAARLDVTGAEPSQDRLSISALAGDDVVDASGLAANAIGLDANGGDGDDVLIGSAGPDTLLGAAGDDTLIGGPGVDVLDGGTGDNVVIQD